MPFHIITGSGAVIDGQVLAQRELPHSRHEWGAREITQTPHPNSVPYPRGLYFTVKEVSVLTIPPGVVTLIFPVVAPAGTWTLILVAVSLVMIPGTPSKATSVQRSRLVPLMVTTAPTRPELGLKLVMAGDANIDDDTVG